MRRKTISVDELQFGMYVARLDQPWEGTPFMYQGFHVRNEEQMAQLRSLCKTVDVDLDQDESGADEAPRSATPLTGIKKKEYRETVPIEAELAPAREAISTAEMMVAAVMKASAGGGPIDVPALKSEVERVSQSVMRNPHAAALITVMREGSEYLVDRAMNTSVYLIMFARFLGMEQRDIELAGLVGLVQDVGMAKVPYALVTRNGALTQDELALVRKHVESGLEQLAATPGIEADVTRFAGMHHERYDGSGYPKGLKGGDIPTVAACSALVDTFTAMTRARPYAEPIPPSKALGLLHRWRGKTFHPTLVEEFIRCVGAFPVGSVVELNSGEIGIVISQSPEKRLQPRVMVVRDAGGQPLRPQKLLDLARRPKASEDEEYRIRRTIEYGRSGVGLRDVMMQ